MPRRSISGLHKSARLVFASFIRDSKSEVQRIEERRATAKMHASEIQLVLMVLMEKLFGIYSNAWISTWESKPKLHVSVWNADSFKDERVLSALSFLNGEFDADGTVDYASVLNREYRFSNDRFSVALDVSVRSDSPTCRKVKIGEELRTYTDTKYRIECD